METNCFAVKKQRNLSKGGSGDIICLPALDHQIVYLLRTAFRSGQSHESLSIDGIGGKGLVINGFISAVLTMNLWIKEKMNIRSKHVFQKYYEKWMRDRSGGKEWSKA